MTKDELIEEAIDGTENEDFDIKFENFLNFPYRRRKKYRRKNEKDRDNRNKKKKPCKRV
jgi:hypothetical protein